MKIMDQKCVLVLIFTNAFKITNLQTNNPSAVPIIPVIAICLISYSPLLSGLIVSLA